MPPLFQTLSYRLLTSTAPRTRPPLVLLRLLVVDKQLPLLTVASRLIACDFDDGEIAIALAEDTIHFFERAICRLGVEEVDDGYDEGVATVFELKI